MNKFSLATATLLLGSSLFAESNTINEAFANGKFSGDVVLYGQTQDNNGGTPDSGYTNGSVGLNYETDSYNGFKLNLGFRSNHEISEDEEDDYSDGTEPRSLLGVANITYENDMFALILGRQEIDLEWIGDYHEAAVAVVKAIPDTTIIAGHTNKVAVMDPDAPLVNFTDFRDLGINDNHGASLVHAMYGGIEGLALEAYYYKAKDVANWYGFKAGYDMENIGASAHYAKSNEKVTGAEDGDITHIEVHGSFMDVALSAGYITTDNDGGTGSMTALGDNISPFEDGNQVYGADADTTYVGIGYEIGSVALGALYGQTDYAGNDEEELNLTVDYAFNDNLGASLVYVDVEAEDSDNDYDRIGLTLTYSF